MLRAILATFLVALLQSYAVSCDAVFLTSYMNQKQLGDQTGSFMLYWTYNTTYIEFEVQFNQGAWGLFGIRDPYSTMNDAVLFWLNSDATGHFSNVVVFSDPNNYTYYEFYQNWIPINAVQMNDTFVFHFGRDIKFNCSNSSASSSGTLDISAGNVSLVYSVGNNINTYNYTVTIQTLKTVSVTLLNPSNGPFTCPPSTSVSEFNSYPSTVYDNYVDLMDGGMARLYWNYNDTTFTGELHVRTSGWVSFGFSPNGDMPGSDVMVFWRDQNRNPVFSERYLYGDSNNPYGAPRGANRTTNQSWNLLYYSYYNGYTVVQFQRPIVLCGKNQLTIPTGTPFGIFAFGTSTPASGGDIGYHGPINRGSKQSPFINIDKPEYNLPSDMTIEEFTISNTILPYSKTTYYCQPFKIPNSYANKKHHAYAYEVVLPTINTNNIHHILLYECPDSFYNGSFPLESGSCNQTGAYCPIISLGWAVGGNTFQFFPSDTGYPMGGDTDYKYFKIELHYNNPEEKLGYVSNLIFRYYLTQQLRPNELGVLTLGTSADFYGIAIPPGIPDFKLNTYCSNDCIKGKLAQIGQNITAISVLLHTHLTGTSVSTKMLRNGQMIGYLANNPYYNFNFQYSMSLSPRINITKNDALITSCTYNTQSRTGFTFGGEETTDEMCYNFVTYYPRNQLLRSCISAPDFGSYVSLFSNLTTSGEMTIDSSSFYDISKVFTEAYSTVRVTDNLRNIYKSFFQKTNVFEFCDQTYNPGPLKPLTYSNNYTDPNPCNPTSSDDKSFIQKVTDFFKNLWDKFKKIFKF